MSDERATRLVGPLGLGVGSIAEGSQTVLVIEEIIT